jgi:O-methyltransferase
MRFGPLEIRRTRHDPPFPLDYDESIVGTIQAVRPYTMTSPDRVFGLCKAVEYIVKAGIQGDMLECGSCSGGSMMAVALTLLRLGDTTRKLYLYDTFEGMPAPTANDVDLFGDTAQSMMDNAGGPFLKVDLETTRRNMSQTGYPPNRIFLVPGRVEETIPTSSPERIALLRLDTDWYDSTRHELVHLFPRLSRGGVLIIDDYGHWQGARKATDEYFSDKPILLNRMDYTGRMAVKM